MRTWNTGREVRRDVISPPQAVSKTVGSCQLDANLPFVVGDLRSKRRQFVEALGNGVHFFQ